MLVTTHWYIVFAVLSVSVGIVYRYCNIYQNGFKFSISILMLELLISGVLNIWYTRSLIINDNDRKYKHIVDYYLNFNERYNNDENNVSHKNSHKTIAWLGCYYVHPLWGWTYYFCFCRPPSDVRRPALHLVSAHLRKKYNSYHYQIWLAGLLGK